MKDLKNSFNFTSNDDENIKDDYYKAYEKRYKQIYAKNMLWSSKKVTPDVLQFIKDYQITKTDKILDLGCGEGRDAIHLLDEGYNLLAVDYSQTVINKCIEISNYKYQNQFKQFDLINDTMEEKFDYIYSISVLHMFVLEEHRNKYLSFVRKHLKDNGKCLFTVMGDGKKEYVTDIKNAFQDANRVVINNNTPVEIATTSCKIVNWKNFEKEITKNNLVIEKKWISKNIPEFGSSMCVIVKKKS